jgi:uncharacterized protein (TIGR02598 family)
VEVALAVGVTIVAITGLLAIMVVGMGVARDATDDTLVATIAQDIFNDIRSQPFNSVTMAGPSRNLETFTGLDGTLYFDGQGYGVPPANAYFRCELRYSSVAPTGHLAGAHLTIYWPAPSTVSAPLFTNSFYTRVARATSE